MYHGFNPHGGYNRRRRHPGFRPGFGGIRPGIILPGPLPFLFVLPL